MILGLGWSGVGVGAWRPGDPPVIGRFEFTCVGRVRPGPPHSTHNLEKSIKITSNKKNSIIQYY